MCQKYTAEELNTMNHDAKNAVICQMQERLDKLEHDYERLMEQIRLADQERFGRHTEKLNEIAGQLSFFNEIEACYDETAKEPTIEEVTDDALKKPRKPKQKGQREEDLKDFPQEVIPHDVSENQLISTFGEATIKVCRMKSAGSYVLNRANGLPKNMSSRCMLERTDFIRMNFFEETTREYFSVAVLPLHHWKQQSSTQSM